METAPNSLDRLSDRLNPIVVRELRQLVRSKTVLGALMFLLILLMISTLFFILASATSDPFASKNLYAGKHLFNWFNGFLTFSGMFFVPIYVGARLAKERASGNDLLYITTLSAHKIISGKVLAGVMITVLLFSICLPFLSFSYLLRGIDLPTIFSSLVVTFIEILCLIYIAIAAALFPGPHVLRLLGGLALLFNLFYAVGMSIAGTVAIQKAGISTRLADLSFWLYVGFTAVCILQGLALCHCAGVAWLSPESSNRTRPIRLLAWFSWVFYAVVALLFALASKDGTALNAWGIVSFTFATVLWLVAINEREQPGFIVARDIPQSALPRFRSWLTFSGSGGGLVSGLLLFALTMGLLMVRHHTGMFASSLSGFSMVTFNQTLCLGLYLFGFCLLALLLRRTWLKYRLQPRLTWILAVVLIGLTPVFYLILMLFTGQDMDNYTDFFQPGNVFNVHNKTLLQGHFYAALAFSLVMLIAHLRWLTGQWKSFRPPEPEHQESHA